MAYRAIVCRTGGTTIQYQALDPPSLMLAVKAPSELFCLKCIKERLFIDLMSNMYTLHLVPAIHGFH